MIDAVIEGVPRLLQQIRRLPVRYGRVQEPTAMVVYTAPYAVYVHENLEAYHATGNAKFLEGPLRRLAPELRRMIADKLRGGGTLEGAVVETLRFLLQESRKEVPVDTGFLRESGKVVQG